MKTVEKKTFMDEDTLFNPITLYVSPIAMTATPRAQGRFLKIGKNAQHALTVDMRRMKDDLALTTRQLVNALTAFEKEFGFSELDRASISRDFIPMGTVLMSSYLQGWVLQDSYMESVHNRIKRLYQHKIASLPSSPKEIIDHGVKAMFNKWFNELGLSNGLSSAPIRAFARAIAPFYKRPVTAKYDGIFTLGESYSANEQIYMVTEPSGIEHSYVLNRAEEVLFKSGDAVKRGEVIQFSVLYPLVDAADGKIYFDLDSPSADHTAFFRWYTASKPPRSIQSFLRIEEAVAQAKAAHLEAKTS